MNQTGTLQRVKQASLGGLNTIAMIAIMALGLVVLAMILRGAVWAAEKAIPWLIIASGWAQFVCLFVLGPLSLFRRTRRAAGIGFITASFVFGAMLLAFSCLFVVYTWGYVALVAGLLFAGVGVFLVALLAALVHLDGYVLLELVIGFLLTFGTRFLGAYLTDDAR